jgi:hypothetical protein
VLLNNLKPTFDTLNHVNHYQSNLNSSIIDETLYE